MGLQNDFSKFGVTFTDAYHRITSLNYRVEEYRTPMMGSPVPTESTGSAEPAESQWTKRAYGSGEIETYATEAARTAHSESLARTHFSFNYDLEAESTWIEQAYAHVKTLPNFTGSIDIL